MRVETQIGVVARLGSARLQRAGFGILPKRTFVGHLLPGSHHHHRIHTYESSPPQNAAAGTLQACAPQTCTTPLP